MKYILLSDSEFFDEYDDQAEALLAYRKYVAVSGGYIDFTLCKILETHEAPEQEHIPYKSHYGVDYSKHDYPE